MGIQYYLDAVNGDDISGDGSSQAPWRTLFRAQGVLNSGDQLILRNINRYAANRLNHPDWIIHKMHQNNTSVTWRKTCQAD